MSSQGNRARWRTLAAATALAASLLLAGSCFTTAGGNGDDANTGQTWVLTFLDSGSAPHPQTIRVYVAPFTTSSTWGEVGGGKSPGLYMYAPDGCSYRIMVGGNSFHDSPGDRFECVNLGGAGCGMQTLGSCSLTADGNFPNATTMHGTYTLTTTSPLGTVTGTNDIEGYRE